MKGLCSEGDSVFDLNLLGSDLFDLNAVDPNFLGSDFFDLNPVDPNFLGSDLFASNLADSDLAAGGLLSEYGGFSERDLKAGLVKRAGFGVPGL